MSVDADHELATPDGANTATLFGSTTQCDAKQVSDGIISAHDFAVIMWAQFRVAPYDGLPADKSSITTVQGRERTQNRCNAGITPQEYQLQLADESTFCLAGTPEASQQRARQLEEIGGGALIQAPVARQLEARVTRWASIPGLGEWSRIELLEDEPSNMYSLELFLV